MLAASRADSWEDKRNDAILTMMYAGARRESEVMALKVEDTWLETMDIDGQTRELLFMFVSKSKNDQKKKRHTGWSARWRTRCCARWCTTSGG